MNMKALSRMRRSKLSIIVSLALALGSLVAAAPTALAAGSNTIAFGVGGSAYNTAGDRDFCGVTSTLETATVTGLTGNSLKIIKNAGAANFGGLTISKVTSPNFFLTTGQHVVTMKIKTTAAVDVTLKIPNGSTGWSLYKTVTATPNGSGISNISFDFDSPTTTWKGSSWYNAMGSYDPAGNYRQMDLIIDPQNLLAGDVDPNARWGSTCEWGGAGATSAKTYYIDDISFYTDSVLAVDIGAGSDRYISAQTTGILGTYDKTADLPSWKSYYGSGLGWYDAYAYQGSTVNITYQVKLPDGTAVANAPTTFIVNKGYSGSAAKFSSPSGINASTTSNGTDGAAITVQTDSNGYVSLALTNSDDYCLAPDAPTSFSNKATSDGIWSQITVITANSGVENIDILELHFVKNPALERKCVFPAHKTDLVTSQASISVDGNDVTCNATPGTLPYEGERFFNEQGYPDGIFRSYSLPTKATYYLVYNGVPVWAKSTADKTDAGSAFADYIQTKSASLTAATFSIPKTWNENHSATVACRIQQYVDSGAGGTSTSPAVILKASGKSKKVKSLAKTTNVTMRLVAGFLNKDKNGAPTDYVDFSSDPIQNHWSQYYGPNLGVYYKYIKVGSSTTMTWNVTDAVTGAPYALKTVYLIVNKNYGGQENATFIRPGGGAVNANPENWSLRETRIMGITDPAGNVTFTLKNTNSATQAEPAPEALNKIQPTSVAPLFSTITLTAGLPETQETKDIIWGHITK